MTYKDENKRKEYQKEWYQKNRDKMLERGRQYAQEHKEEAKLRSREWYSQNRERRLQKSKEWYQKNREKISQQTRKYNREHREEMSKYRRNWKKDKRRTDFKYRLNANVGSAISKSLKGKKVNRKWEVLVEYTFSDLIKYLEKKFDDKMTWDNYGSYWAIDHIKPQSLFEIEEFRKCWALENLQPMEKIANMKKSNNY